MDLKKVHTKDDGTYWWTSEVDDEFVLYSIRLAFITGGIYCAIVMLFALLVSPDTKTVLIFLASCVGVMLFIGMICGIIWLTRHRQRMPYELTGEFVRYGRTRKDMKSVFFNSVIRTEEDGNKIRLFTKHWKHLVFVPEEDFAEIRDFILDRIEKESKFH